MLQDDDSIRESLDAALIGGQKQVTVHIPTDQILDSGCGAMLRAAKGAMNWLRLRAVSRINSELGGLVAELGEGDVRELLERHGEVRDHLRNESFNQLWQSGDVQLLSGQAEEVLDSPSESPDARFVAGLHMERVILTQHGTRTAKAQERLGSLLDRLCGVARLKGAGAAARSMYVVMHRSKQLQLAADADYHYWAASEHVGRDSLAGIVAESAAGQAALKMAGLLYRHYVLANRLASRGLMHHLSELVSRTVPSLAMYKARLDLAGEAGTSEVVRDWVGFLLDFQESWARKQSDESRLAEVATAVLAVAREGEQLKTAGERARAIAAGLKESTLRDAVLSTIERLEDTDGQHAAPSTPQEEVEFFASRAQAMGFDLHNPKDRLGQVIALGLRDYNPERVMKDCDHLMVFPGPVGVPAELVGLHFAGAKFLRCMLHGYAMGGWSLDELYGGGGLPIGGFKQRYCDQCSGCAPRSPGWHWSSEWYGEQLRIYADIHKNLWDMH